MRRAARVDVNQSSIVDDLRAAGVSVQPLHGVGMGCPDLLCGWRGCNFVFEVKDPDKPPSGRKLTDWQETWHVKWSGQVDVIHSAEDALQIMGAVK